MWNISLRLSPSWRKIKGTLRSKGSKAGQNHKIWIFSSKYAKIGEIVPRKKFIISHFCSEIYSFQNFRNINLTNFSWNSCISKNYCPKLCNLSLNYCKNNINYPLVQYLLGQSHIYPWITCNITVTSASFIRQVTVWHKIVYIKLEKFSSLFNTWL